MRVCVCVECALAYEHARFTYPGGTNVLPGEPRPELHRCRVDASVCGFRDVPGMKSPEIRSCYISLPPPSSSSSSCVSLSLLSVSL